MSAQGIFIWGGITEGSGDGSSPVGPRGKDPVESLGPRSSRSRSSFQTLFTHFDRRNDVNLKFSARFTPWFLSSLFHGAAKLHFFAGLSPQPHTWRRYWLLQRYRATLFRNQLCRTLRTQIMTKFVRPELNSMPPERRNGLLQRKVACMLRGRM